MRFPVFNATEVYTLSHKTRADYLRALMLQPRAWVAGSAANPSASMLRQPSTITLHHIALRRMGA